MHILHIELHIGCILFGILFCIFRILPSMHFMQILCMFCILFAYYFAYYYAYYAYRMACILHIFCILFCIFDAYYFEYYFAYSAYYDGCILCILCILYNAYCTMHIVHIMHILDEKVVLRVFIVYFHYCLVPQLRAQLFTYHHLQPSPLLADLSQKAPGKSAASRRMAKGIVPVAPTGTRGRRPSMEDTRITYKTCACSRRS